VLLDHVRIVEEPLARGADVLVGVRGCGEPGSRRLEDVPRIVEPRQQRRAAIPLIERTEDLRARDLADTVGEPLYAEELATDRTGQNVMRRTGSAAKERAPKAGSARAESKFYVHELSTVASLRPRSVEKSKLRATSGLRGRHLRLFRR